MSRTIFLTDLPYLILYYHTLIDLPYLFLHGHYYQDMWPTVSSPPTVPYRSTVSHPQLPYLFLHGQSLQNVSQIIVDLPGQSIRHVHLLQLRFCCCSKQITIIVLNSKIEIFYCAMPPRDSRCTRTIACNDRTHTRLIVPLLFNKNCSSSTVLFPVGEKSNLLNLHMPLHGSRCTLTITHSHRTHSQWLLAISFQTDDNYPRTSRFATALITNLQPVKRLITDNIQSRSKKITINLYVLH